MNETNQSPAMHSMLKLTRSEWRIDAKPKMHTLRGTVHSQHPADARGVKRGQVSTMHGTACGLGEIRFGRKRDTADGESGSIAAAF